MSIEELSDKYRILIIDDDNMLQQAIRTFLLDLGFKPISASNATEGLNLAINKKPILIILDLAMPEISGEILIKFIKAVDQTRHIPVMILSGSINKDVVMKMFKEGAVSFVSKPFQPQTFLTKLKTVIPQVIFQEVTGNKIKGSKSE